MPLIRMPRWAYLLLISQWFATSEVIGRHKGPDSLATFLRKEYAIWKAGSPVESNTLLWNLYKGYKESHNWDMGLKTLIRLNPGELTVDQKSEANIQKSLMHLMMGNYTIAAENGITLENDSLTPAQRKLLYSILLVSLIEKGEYRLSQTKLERYLSMDSVQGRKVFATKERYRNQVAHMSRLHLKSVKKARRLSMFLPSAGLFYAGSPRKGLVNLGLQLTAAGYLAANILFQNYATAATFNLHILRQFYTGGVNQTNAVVNAYNKERLHAEEDKLEQILFQLLRET